MLVEAISESSHHRARVLFFVDQGVFEHWPDLNEQIGDYCQRHCDRLTMASGIQQIPGGEQCKNDPSVFKAICETIHNAQLCRHSFVIAIGGGAVLDVVGFAASVVHRGIRFIRLPTTSLAQADAGIGVKNGINAFGKKNFLGTFSVPWMVINDPQFLTTQSNRDWRCGLSEAVKVALVKDSTFFDQLVAATPALIQRNLDVATSLLHQSALLHLSHIADGGDPFELDQGRPLDFGHWAAHKLEQMSDYRLRHGEAVAIGVALDVVYSWRIGLLSKPQTDAVLDCLTGLGFRVNDPVMNDTTALLAGLDEFRQHLGGQLSIPLLTAIGQTINVDRIDRDQMMTAVQTLTDTSSKVNAVATEPAPWSVS